MVLGSDLDILLDAGDEDDGTRGGEFFDLSNYSMDLDDALQAACFM